MLFHLGVNDRILATGHEAPWRSRDELGALSVEIDATSIATLPDIAVIAIGDPKDGDVHGILLNGSP